MTLTHPLLNQPITLTVTFTYPLNLYPHPLTTLTLSIILLTDFTFTHPLPLITHCAAAPATLQQLHCQWHHALPVGTWH